jgi:hypothetical protein
MSARCASILHENLKQGGCGRQEGEVCEDALKHSFE